jgi:transposase-like protein
MSKTKNNEIKNILLRTVIKLYEGSYPTHNVKLAHKSKKVLGSRFLSVEKDDESTIEPIVRRNLDDFYKSANGVEIINFSKSSTFFPSRTEAFYSFERVAEMAKNSPYVTLEDFFDYVKTRPDNEKFASWIWYTASKEYEEMGFHKFFGLDALEKMREDLIEKSEKIVQDCIKKEYKLLYVSKLLKELWGPYSPDKPEYNPSLFEGVKGGKISNTENGIRHMYQQKYGKVADRIGRYASQEKFEEYCKKFNIRKKEDLKKSKNSQMEVFEIKHGITKGFVPDKVYTKEFVDRIFTLENPYGSKNFTLQDATLIGERVSNGERINKIAEEFGVNSHSISNLLKRHNIKYKSKNDTLKSINPRTVEILLLERGKDYRGAAKELGVSVNTISRIVKKNKIPYVGKFSKKP